MIFNERMGDAVKRSTNCPYLRHTLQIGTLWIHSFSMDQIHPDGNKRGDPGKIYKISQQYLTYSQIELGENASMFAWAVARLWLRH